MFNANESIKAQRKLCIEKEYPHFAPNNGRCWSCNRQIYEEIKHDRIIGGVEKPYMTGISVEKASSELITGCPHCNRSYCD